MGFFKRKSTGAKGNRKRPLRTFGSNIKNKKSKFEAKHGTNKEKIEDDEEIPSSSDEGEDEQLDQIAARKADSSDGKALDDQDQEEEEYEDNNALVYREAKRLIETIKDAGEEDEEEKIEEKKQRVHRKIADHTRFDKDDNGKMFVSRSHRLSPVCICFSNCGQFLVSCAKDGFVVKYDLNKRCRVGLLKQDDSNGKSAKGTKKKSSVGKKRGTAEMHRGQVLCCAISPNDKFLATGSVDRMIKIWDFASLAFVRNFDGHRGPITSIRFRQSAETLEMYTASRDRTIMVWNMDEMGLMNTLYGHQDAIEQLDVLEWPRLISCGGMEKCCRYFKILDDSHLVFNGLSECLSIDCVALINEEHFVSGSIDGSIYIWSITRKKPVCIRRLAHGRHPPTSLASVIPVEIEATAAETAMDYNGGRQHKAGKERGGEGEPRWISALAAHPHTDLIASGSSDGFLRLWRVSPSWKRLDPVDQFAMPGFINDIRFSPDGSSIGCAIGQEHKRGRWWTLKGDQGVQNRIVVVPLVFSDPEIGQTTA